MKHLLQILILFLCFQSKGQVKPKDANRSAETVLIPEKNKCNPNNCLDLLERLEALQSGAFANYHPTHSEIKPILDSVTNAFQQSPEGRKASEDYQKAFAAYEKAYDRWSKLPAHKQKQVPEPQEPENPINGSKGAELRALANRILRERNRTREMEITNRNLTNCKCNLIGFGNPTPVFNEFNIVNDIRNSLPQFKEDPLFNKAKNDQMGIIGSDFRERERIGSAAFERKFTGGFGKALDAFGASTINFWQPQKRSGETQHFKQTLSGLISRVGKTEEETILPDHDVNIFVRPSANYRFLVDEAKKPELTMVTRIGQQYKKQRIGCPIRFSEVEAEIDSKESVKRQLLALTKERLNQNICLYGPWIFDIGHCAQPEIHPAEQIWWSTNDLGNDRVYNLNLICDASKRYWFRSQMDGQKLKPWGAPPIKGVFAIAFEVTQGRPAKTFEVFNIDHFNVIVRPNTNKVYNLVFKNNTIISFIPKNDAFKVSYEHVGITADNKIRGFLVIETEVGKVTQTATKVLLPGGTILNVPPNSDVNKVPEVVEKAAFKKVEGHYMFKVVRSNFKQEPVIF